MDIKIGYPEFTYNDNYLNQIYKDVWINFIYVCILIKFLVVDFFLSKFVFDEKKYFENYLLIQKLDVANNIDNIRKPIERKK